MVAQIAHPSDLLRRALRGNSIFSFASGLLLTFGAAPIAAFMGIADDSLVLTVMGIIILVFAAFLWITTAKPVIDRQIGIAIFIMDVAWVVVSLIILVTDAFSLSTGGRWAILIVADIVAVFALLEFVGLRRLR
jgi:Na+-translocating ferredoxin:NAD+ oxidoreductase RnfE subunit